MSKKPLIRWPENSQDHAEFARQFLRYEPETGLFYWIIDKYRAKAGSQTGNIMPSGYVQIRLAQRTCRAHRLAWLMHYGEWPDSEIDHINHNRSDNRIVNLRVVDRLGQARNSSRRSDNISGHVGVSFCKRDNSWVARIKSGPGMPYLFLGRYKFKQDAIAIRKAAEKSLGYHKNHGD